MNLKIISKTITRIIRRITNSGLIWSLLLYSSKYLTRPPPDDGTLNCSAIFDFLCLFGDFLF